MAVAGGEEPWTERLSRLQQSRAAREWWGSLYKIFTDIGISGIWNDMNEPAVFETPTGTMPLDVRFDGDGQPADHREIHNVYGLLMHAGDRMKGSGG